MDILQIICAVLIFAVLILIVTVLILLVFITKKLSENAKVKDNLKEENDSLKSFLMQQNSALKQELTANFSGYATNVNNSVANFSSAMQNQMKNFADSQRAATESEIQQLENMRRTMENNLKTIRDDNEKKLEEMRRTVDEKLSSTLEKRLTESFESVSKQLESVYKGLGEMQTLASSVGDLKNALTNVKVRGTWGEVSLDSLLSQILSPEQYERNVKPVPRSNNIVEFCIKLPNNENSDIVYLPIDCKFPIEDYIRLVDASSAGDAKAVEDAGKQLESAIKLNARSIRDKYISPPHTTDFAIMYLPIEGLYAEVARRSGLCEYLQRECRVTVAGPTTIGAFLNSLQLGFKTLAIQKRTGEIAKILEKVRTNFGKFATLLETAKKRIDSAGSAIEDVTKRYENIDKLLIKAYSYNDTSLPDSDEVPKIDEE